MALTETQIISIFKKSKIAYANDAIRAIGALNITDIEIAGKMTKAAFYNAAKFNRKTVTAEDIEKVAAEMHS